MNPWSLLYLIPVYFGLRLLFRHLKYHDLYHLKINDDKQLVFSGRGLLTPVRFRVMQTLTKDKPLKKVFGTFEEAAIFSLDCAVSYASPIRDSLNKMLTNGKKKLEGKK